MKGINLISVFFNIITTTILVTFVASPVQAPDGVDIDAYNSSSANEVRWMSGSNPVVGMYGSGDGRFFLYGGSETCAGSITLIPGDINSQYWYLNPCSNNKGIKIYDDETIVENNLVVNENFSANNFSGTSSGENTGDQTIKNTIGLNLGGQQVPPTTTKYVGLFSSNFAVSSTAAAFPISYSGNIKRLMVNLASEQFGTLKIHVYLNGVSKIVITITDSGTTRMYGNIVDSFDVVRGDKVYVALENLSSSTSAQIAGISMELTQE